MMEMLTYLLAVSWILYSIVLIIKRRFLPVNIYGIMLVVSTLQPFLLFYDIPSYKFHIETDIEVLINRYLFLIAFILILIDRGRSYNKVIKTFKK